jgi:DNA-binding transcriptional MerR regulator
MLVQEVHVEKFARNGGDAVSGIEPDAARGVYGITVAAELVGTGVQNLRAYEARGLLEPERTEGGTRRYSADDLDRLRRIGDLLEAGLNLAGIAMVMELQDENSQLRAEKEEQQWLPTAPINTASIPASRSPKRTSSSNRSRSTRR